MAHNDQGFDSTFLAAQKQRLLDLRATLERSIQDAADDESDEMKANGEAREYEDDAQTLDALDRDGSIERRNVARIAEIDQALGRIESGKYGVSIVSGKPITRARLEAVPEALWDVNEKAPGP
jgi:DnaK suppressor protein